MKHRVKRGRPRLNLARKDAGTPELIAKRQAELTMEPLDICLKRGIITKDAHWAGIHLRWLYAVIFGVPGIKAFDPASLGGKPIPRDNTAWLADREREYAKAQMLLHRMKAYPLVPDVCIFSQHPSFLRIRHLKNSEQEFELHNEYTIFTEGLNGLFALFSGKKNIL